MPDFDYDAALSEPEAQFYLYRREPCEVDDDVGLEDGQLILLAIDVFARLKPDLHVLVGTVYKLSLDGNLRDAWVAAYPEWTPEDDSGEEWWSRTAWWRAQEGSRQAALDTVLSEFKDFTPGMEVGCASWEDYLNTGGIATGTDRLEPYR